MLSRKKSTNLFLFRLMAFCASVCSSAQRELFRFSLKNSAVKPEFSRRRSLNIQQIGQQIAQRAFLVVGFDKDHRHDVIEHFLEEFLVAILNLIHDFI